MYILPLNICKTSKTVLTVKLNIKMTVLDAMKKLYTLTAIDVASSNKCILRVDRSAIHIMNAFKHIFY